MAQRIEDYALIGDCGSAALIGRSGSIDWLCWPRFDSDACFAALLGTEENGRWRIAPTSDEVKVTRRYRPDTLILETHFEAADGAATVIDFMPHRNEGPRSHLVRMVRGERGKLAMCLELVIRFGYGAIVPWVSRIDEQTIVGVAGPDMVVLRAPFRLRGENLRTVGEFHITAGETASFVLSYLPSNEKPSEPLDAEAALHGTETYWRKWVGRSKFEGPWRDAVTRSLITLKALTFGPTGGIVAAPTTSLPEQIGGERNWDYRFCWLRDATMTLLALMDAGYYEEAAAWRDWLLRAVAGSPRQLQIMYGIAGERRLTEWEVPWLRGYENSKPVRIGNAAHSQLQLDVLGELMDTLHQARQGGLAAIPSGWALEKEFLKHLEKIWTEKDSGIWEVRSDEEHFTYSKVMAWVAFDRAIKSAQAFALEGDIDRWQQIRKRIHDDVCTRGIDPERGCFVRAYGSNNMDASLLLLPAVGFLPPTDPRIRATVEAVERELLVDGFVLRYDSAHAADGLPPGEGVFLACSFWLADAYLMIGRRGDAIAMLERLLSLRNDVGLLAEEYDPCTKRQVGNFPQALSHLALVGTATNLTQEEKPAEQRGKSRVSRTQQSTDA
jgi:GH15 family glucan-1,4-alpha-glucosidase